MTPRLIARLPALPAAAVTAAVAAVATVGPLPAGALALALAAGAGALALLSADRIRRLAWTAAAIAAVATAASLVSGPLPLWLPPLADPTGLREALASPLRRLVPEPESAILVGIALGERTAIGPELAAAFARSGTTHLLAISGFNMTLVAAAAGLLIRGRGRPIVRALVTVIAVLAYSTLVTGGASVLRAAAMATVAAVGLALGRRAAAGNALAAAIAVMLVADPATIDDVGFLLSVGATGGLIALQAPIAARLGALPTLAREGLAATLAATLPTIPIVAAIFGRISLVAPAANLIAVPIFAPLMVAAAATAIVGAIVAVVPSFSALALPFALIAFGLARALRAVVEVAAGLPGASLEVPRGPLTAILLGVACAVATRAAPALIARAPRLAWPTALPIAVLSSLRAAWSGRRRGGGGIAAGRRSMSLRVGVLGLSALLVVAAIAVVATRSAPGVRVLALDVGQGDAYLVEVEGRRVLIDGGPDPDRLLAQLGATLPPWDRRIDVIALTHAHLDHGAGLLAVLERYRVGLAVEPLGLNAGALATAWTERAAAAGVPRRVAAAGATVRLGGAVLRFLAPTPDLVTDVPSLVVRLEQGPFSVLFMGDATEAAQAALLLEPAALRARAYVPPHHGSATPYGAALVAAVGPEVAMISAGRDNRYGHPTPETLAALGRIPTYRTDRDGTIELTVSDRGVVVRANANGLAPPRNSRPRGLPRG